MISRAKATVPGIAGNGPRRATAFAVAVICLWLGERVVGAAGIYRVGQAPWVAALFVLPLLYALPGPRRLLDRYRWPVLAVQATLTWVPLAVFGANWATGLGGLLAGLMLLMLPGRVAWPAAGVLLAADLVVRAAVTGLPWAPAWSGAVWVTITFAVDALWLFGIVRLAQIVGQVDEASRQAANLAVAGERLQAAEALQAAVGQRVAQMAATTAAAQQALSQDEAAARAQIAAAGAAAREAVARARTVSTQQARPTAPEPAATGAVISARLAWAVLTGTLVGFAAAGLNDIVAFHDGPRAGALVAAATVLTVALQLRHSGAARTGRRPRAWPVTLAVQAALAYMFFLPPIAAFVVLPGFLAGSVLLLVPGRWRWAGYAVVVLSYSGLFAVAPPPGMTAAHRGAYALYEGATTATVGLLVYGLSRLAGQARTLEGLRSQQARAAAVRERLRVARDVHDLLGLNLSAIALKADLTAALIGRDNARAATEMQRMTRICAATRADIRQVTGTGTRLSLADELAAALQILTCADVQVSADAAPGPLPAAADEVLAPVLREAVTNVLRHSAATTCAIEVTTADGAVRLHVSNDGATGPPAGTEPASTEPAARSGGGRGLANLRARVQAAGGQLTSRRAGARFDLAAEIPLPATARVPAGPAA